MNQIYRTLWSSVLGNWVVTHEHAKAHGKGGRRAATPAGAVLHARSGKGAGAIKPLALALFCAAVSPFALALPEGGVIRSGSGSLVSTGDIMTITQETARLSADFQRFNIAAPETVRAIQPDAASVALFRVLGNDPSTIYGKLIANGQVFLSNPNGILFGRGAQVDVGGLVATTLNIDQADFLAGRHRFQGDASGSVINEGTINAAARGYVALLAPEVRNDGLIVARLGTVALGAGQAATLDFAGNGKVNLQIDQAALNGRVANRQALIADGGQVIMSAGTRDALLNTVVNNQGVVEARRISQEGGVIRLEGGSVSQSGTLDASGVEGAGGAITVTGNHVTLAAGSTTEASGASGGGTILIGGDYQGANPDLVNAQTTKVEAGAVIRADALAQGDGGKVIVWSDQHTGFLGSISAKGGASGGNGGFAEVSGKDVLDYQGHTDLTAPSGKTGTLLLDPKNINIVATGAAAVSGNDEFTENSTGTSKISGATLAAALNSASVLLQANSDITFNDNVTATTAGHGLSLQAGRGISFSANKSLVLNGGDFSARINDDAALLADRAAGTARFSMASGSSVVTNGGAITIGGGNRDGTGANEVRISGTLDAGAGDIGITGVGRAAASSGLYGVRLYGGTVKTTTGKIAITGTGGVGTSSNHGVYLVASTMADALISTDSGEIDIHGTGGAGINSNVGVYLAGNGATFKAKIQSATGDIAVTGNGQGSGSGNRGVLIAGGSEISTAGAGTLALNGSGSSAPGATSGNHGVVLGANALAGSLVQTLGTGGVTLTGTGGNGTKSNYGVVLSGNGAAMKATLQSAAGAINVSGSGGAGSGASNYGVGVLGGGKIASDSGKVALTGQGGAPSVATGSNHGVYLTASASADALITTNSGEIEIDGTGGTGTNNNVGVYLAGSGAVFKARIQSATGDIAVTGNGQGIGSGNRGVVLAGGSDISTAGAGTLALIGRGSSAPGATSGNHGVYLAANALAGSLAQTLGSGSVTVNGTGGVGTSGNYGVVLSGNLAAANKATVQSSSGSISVAGNGGAGSSTANRGVGLLNGGQILTTSGGAVSIVAAGANGANGFYSNGSGTNRIAATGAVAMTASGGNASNPDFRLATGDSISATGAPVTVNTDRMYLAGSINAAGQSVTLRPKTAGRAVNLGSTVDTSATALELSASELNRITAGTLILGDGASGDLSVTSSLAPSNVSALTLRSAGAITQAASANLAVTTLSASGASVLLGNAGNAIVNLGDMTASNGALSINDTGGLVIAGNLAATGGGVTIRTLGDLALNAGAQISTAGADDILLGNGGVGGRFINNSGALALQPGAGGRWRVYSSNPANDARNGLAHDFKQYNAAYGDAVLGSGNGFIYTHAPILTPGLTGSVSKTYDATRTATLAAGHYTTGAIDGDTVTLTGTALYDSKDVGAGKQVSVSGISIASAVDGNATVYGYRLASTTAAANVGVITPAPLTIVADDKDKVVGQANPVLTARYSGFVASEGPGDLFGALNLATPATAASPVGDYPITPSGLSATNYAIAFANGHLRVDPPGSGGSDAGILEIGGIREGAPVVTAGAETVDALNALPATAAGGEGGGSLPELPAPTFVVGEVAVQECGITLPAMVEPDNRCQGR